MEQIAINDFAKVDIRVGTVVDASVPAWSHWVMKLIVDFGEEIGKRTIFTGMMKFYKVEDLAGRQFPFVVNLEPKKIGPKEEDGVQNYSEGMLLAIDSSKDPEDEETKPVLFTVSESVPNGAKIH